MATDDKIKDEKLQYDIDKEAGKTSVSFSSKTDKYEYLAGEEILLSDQRKVIEQAKFTYYPLRSKFQQNTFIEEAKNELNKIKEIKKAIGKENLYYKTNNTYNF